MLIRCTDVETTGLSNDDVAISIAWADVDEDWNIIRMRSFIIKSSVENKAFNINHISQKMINEGKTLDEVKEEWHKESFNNLIAHNIKFDLRFIPNFYIGEKQFCTFENVEWGKGSKKLTHLCCDNGIPVINAHSTIGDVLMLVELCKVKKIEFKKSHTICVTKSKFEENQIYKEHGFHWDPVQKMWFKSVTKIEAYPFSISLFKSSFENCKETIGESEKLKDFLNFGGILKHPEKEIFAVVLNGGIKFFW